MRFLALLFALLVCGCGSTQPAPVSPPTPAPAPVPVAPDEHAFRVQQPPPGTPGELNYPAASVTRLDNGLTLYLIQRPTGLVSMSAVVRSGANVLREGESGLAAFTARMLTEGTKKRSSLDLAKDVEALGTALEHDADRDSVRVNLTTLAEDFDRGISLLSDVIQNPAFNRTDTARVRDEWLDSLDAERQEPSRIAALVGFRTLLGPKTGAPVRGAKKDVSRFGVDQLRRFHRDWFVPNNTALVVAGDIDLDRLKQSAARAFGSWAARPTPPTSSADVSPAGARPARVVLVDRPSAVQSAIFAAQKSPARSEPGFEARELFNAAVGGLFTSRLNTNLRETHAYTYGVRSAVVATRAWGAFVVMTSVRTDVTAAALTEVLAELAAARTQGKKTRLLEDEELARARADLIQRTAASLQGTAQVRGELEELFLYELGPDYLTRYPEVLRKIPREAVQKEADRVTPENLVMVVVGDRKEVENQLTQGGFEVEVADPAWTE